MDKEKKLHLRKKYLSSAENASRSEKAGNYQDALKQWKYALFYATGENIIWCKLRIEWCEKRILKPSRK
ncbi:ANR family transcriptional regulator [Escherichia coli]|uniref:ANR family transcriptional regulator n=1 Tax=Escherichia coli TaxID=562 RepID=UPI0039DF5DF3